jgi:DNA-directed RNA polymerase specialized sigma24 family protein
MSPGGDRAGQRPRSDGDGPAATLGRGLGAASEAAFREYVTARDSALLRMALPLTGNRADAEDLLQAVLAKTYLAWDRIQDQAALDPYVKRAMVNTQISWWRRRRVDEYPTGELPDRALSDQVPEIADVVGVSRGTVKSTMSRAVAKLRTDAELSGRGM